MVDLRVGSSLRVSAIVVGLLLAGGIANASDWLVDDIQVNSSPDFDYRVKIYEIENGVPDLLDTQEYTYTGQIGYDYYWEVRERVYGIAEGNYVWCEVQYRYLGGAWQYSGEFYAEELP